MSALGAFFRPESVAVVGAAERATSSGGAVLRNARVSGYRGTLIPVNQKGGEIFGIPARTSLRQIDPPADLVVVVVRPDLILEVVREAGETGHKRVLVLPGGFAEAGREGAERDAALQQLAAHYGIIIAGPNCAGIIDQLDTASPFAATFLRDMPRGGGVAFVSQSGAIAEQVIAKSHDMGLPIGAIVSVGNAMHLGVTDYLEHYGADERCSVVALYVESFGELRRFESVARAVVRTKPVVVLVGGRSATGVAAVRRHTGGTALGDHDLDAMLAECGVLRVRSLRRLLIACKGLGAFPTGMGNRVLLLSNSGGPGVLTTDSAAREGLILPDLPAALAASLRAMLPEEAAIANPLDLLADAREDRFGESLKLALEHGRDAYDAILMLHVVPFMVDASPVVARLAGMAREAGMPMMHAMMGTLPARKEWFDALESAGVPAFDDAEEMAVAAAIAARYRIVRQALVSAGGTSERA